jgi:hypothetical protein
MSGIMVFHPADERSTLLKPYCIASDLSAKFDEVHSKRALTGYAHSMVNMGVQCLLVGFDEPGYQLLEKGRSWLRVAIDEHEIPRGYFQYATEARRLWEFSLCGWLLDGKHDVLSLKLAVDLREQYYRPQRPDKMELGLALPTYLEAGEYEVGIKRYETIRGMAPPESPRKALGEGRMAYVMCLHREQGLYDAKEVERALRRFLRRHVPESLDGAHYSTAAQWMKIAHWDGVASRESAHEALLRCYDYLSVAKPDVV